jgi:hypothetical protein
MNISSSGRSFTKYMHIHRYNSVFTSPNLWRIVMTSLNSAKGLRRPLMLVSAALLFYTGASRAADAGADAHTQARELLGGKTPSRTMTSAVRRDRAVSIPGVDAQEQARRLLSGAQHFDKTPAVVRFANTSGMADEVHRSAHNNAQQLAQRMILGRSYRYKNHSSGELQ